MAEALQWLAYLLPLTYAYDALDQVTQVGEADAALWLDVAVIAGATVLALVGGAATLRRRTA
jgi:ABC-2 type transport system permease protein